MLPTLLNLKIGIFYIPNYSLRYSLYNAPSEFSVKKVLVEKGFRCTLPSDDAVKGAKERLPREEEEREGKWEEGIQLKIFLTTANNYDTHCITCILIDEIPQTYQ